MAEQKDLNKVLRDIKKKFGESVVKVGVEDLSVDGVLSLGSPSADFAIYGGVPEGRIIELFGAEGSGKTTTAFLIAAQYIRDETARHPVGVEWTDNDGNVHDMPRGIILLDNEGTADPTWALKLGYDMNNADVPTYTIRPEAQSAEDIFDIAIDLLKTGDIGLLIFDSIATLVPQQIVDESQTKKAMGGVAAALTRFANTAIGLLRKYKSTLVAINQVRENMSGYGDPLITPGGRSWKHACSMRLMFKRGDFFNDKNEVIAKKDATSPAGHIVEMYVVKTKVCPWDRKLAYYHLNYDRGVDILWDTLDVAQNFGFIDNSTQGYYKIVDPDTGEISLDEEGKELKFHGKSALVDYYRENTVAWRKLYDLCYDKLRIKGDPYIVSFEKLLDIDMNEKFGTSEVVNVEEI